MKLLLTLSIHPTLNISYIEKNMLLFINSNILKKIKLKYLVFNIFKFELIISYTYLCTTSMFNKLWNTYIRTLITYLGLYKKRILYKFEVRGFSYKLRRDYNLFMFKLGYSHLVYYHLNMNTLLSDIIKKKRDTNTYLLYGHSRHAIGQQAVNISNLRKVNVYSSYGIRTQMQKLFLKKGKVSLF